MSLNKIIGNRVKNVIGNTAYKFALKYIEEVRKGKSTSYENILDMKEGKRWIKVSYVPIFDSKGHVVSIIVMSYDITEQKNTTNEIKESEEKYKSLFNNSAIGMYRTKLDGSEVLEFNNKYCSILGVTQKEVVGKPSNILWIHPKEREKMVKTLMSTGHVDELEFQMKRKDGKIIDAVTSVRLYREQGILEGSIIDMTEKKLAEKELKESEEKYKLLVDRMQEITVILDRTGKILFANKFTLNTIGYTEKEVIGNSVFTFITKDSIKKAIYNLTQEFLDKKTGAWEIELITKKGEIRTIALSEASNPIYKDKKIVELLVNGIDITEQKKAEELNKNIIKCTTDWIWEVNLQGKYTYCSENVKSILGYDIKEMIGKTPFDFMIKKERERIAAVFEEIVKNQKPIKDLENWNVHKDGHNVCLLTNGFPVFDENSKLKGYRGADKDITERKKAEQEIINSKKLLQRIIDLLPIRIFWKDTNLKFLGGNNIFAKDAGKRDSEELIGKDDFQMSWKEQAKLYRDDDQKVIKSGKSKINFEEQQTTPKGNKIWLNTSKVPLIDSKGKSIGILGSYEDITEKKKAEEKLKESEEKYLAILNSSTDQIFMIDKNLQYISVNRALAQSMEKIPENIIGKSIKQVYGNTKQTERFSDNIKYILENKKSLNIEEPLILREKILIINTQLNPIINTTGEITAVLGILRDVTEKKESEKELIKSQNILQEKIADLERFNRISVDRELKMIELKHKIQELEEKLGKK